MHSTVTATIPSVILIQTFFLEETQLATIQNSSTSQRTMLTDLRQLQLN